MPFHEIDYYEVIGPDDYPLHGRYETRKEAEMALLEFVERYRQQGYYSSPENGRIPVDRLADFCTIILREGA